VYTTHTGRNRKRICIRHNKRVVNWTGSTTDGNTLKKRVLLKIKYEEKSDTKCIQKQLQQRGSIKLVHDTPWYWKIYLATNNPH